MKEELRHLPIGATFQYKGAEYQVVEVENELQKFSCGDCAFLHKNYTDVPVCCFYAYRRDKKNVYFKQVLK